jgi:hypothetical protein
MLTFRDLWRNHPANESVATPCIAPRDLTNLEGKHIGKGFPVFSNQCAIRMSVTLKRCGVTPGQLSSAAHCSVHSREEMHLINASQVANAIARANLPGVGPIQRITGKDASEFYPHLFGRTGLIYIQDYWARSTDRPGQPTGDHIDVWNGYRPTTKWLMEWFSWLGYYSNYAQAREIWFWDVK